MNIFSVSKNLLLKPLVNKILVRSNSKLDLSLALTLLETYKNYKVPTGPELFWMIPHDEDIPQQCLPLPEGIFIDPSEDYMSNDDGQRVRPKKIIRFYFFVLNFMIKDSMSRK